MSKNPQTKTAIAAEAAPAPASAPTPVRGRLWKTALIVAIATGHAIAMLYAGGNMAALLTVMFAPGILSMALVRGGGRHWYAWCALWALVALAVHPDSLSLVLWAGMIWLLCLTWIPARAADIRISWPSRPGAGV